MNKLIISTVLILGAQWWFFGDLTSISNNIYVTIGMDFIGIIILAGAMCGPTQMTTDIMDAEIRMNKHE